IWVVVMSIAASESLWTLLAQTPHLTGKSEEPLPTRRGLSGLRRRTYRLGSKFTVDGVPPGSHIRIARTLVGRFCC
ncbi:MAG: hypothetical protein WCF79_05420, partial [Rhodomicrobium sp.]